MIDIQELADRVPVSRPGDVGYDAERAGFQTADTHRPALTVGARDSADVRAAVGFAGAHGLPVAVQATGHGQSVPADGGMLINTRRLAGVRVDAGARTARIDAGVRWGQVITEAARHGLAPLSGSSPDVGAVSYTLAGGLGLLARRYGYAADHVRALDVVTADGRLRRATARREPDLFWALRGAGPNFGVVTGMEMGLVPVTRLYGGGLFFDTDRVADVLHLWRRWTETVPEALTSSVALIPFPDVPAVPEPLRGRYAAHVRIAHTGTATEGARLVAPLRAAGPPLIDTLGELPYTASGSICTDPTTPHAYHGTSAMLAGLDDTAVSTVLDLAGPGAPVTCVVQLNHLGGALARPPAVAGAVGHRDARYLLRVISPLTGDDRRAEVAALHQGLYRALGPAVTGRSLGFHFGAAAGPDLVRNGYDGVAHRRLAELKAAYDPANMFRFNHNIAPAPGPRVTAAGGVAVTLRAPEAVLSRKVGRL